MSVLLSLVFTMVCLPFWLSFKPVPVDLVLSGYNNLNINVALNKQNNNGFGKAQYKQTNANIKNDSSYRIDIDGILVPKRLRINFVNIKNNSPIYLKELYVNNQKINVNQIEDFVVYTGKIEKAQEGIKLTSSNGLIRMIYNKELKTFAPFEFTWEMFFIIFVLSFLLMYKLTNYIVSFKEIKGKSRIEIVFLSLFFLVLFLPMMYIDDREISRRENRALTKYKPLITKDYKINYNFGRDFDAWFSDRFLLRVRLIKLYYSQFSINKQIRTPKVIKGKENWLFNGIPGAIDLYTNKNLYNEDAMKLVAKRLQKIDEYCKKHNKQFYFMIAPSKCTIYGEYFTDTIKPRKEDKIACSEQLIKYLKENTNVKVIFPKKELLENKDKSLLYWKTDTHWNEYGGYIGYRALMKEINANNHNKIPIFNAKKFTKVTEKSGNLNKMLSKKIREKVFSDYLKPENPTGQYYCEEKLAGGDIQYCSSKNSNKKLVIFRDSFTINMLPYLASSFRKSTFVKQNWIDVNVMPDADIVVFEVLELYLQRLVETEDKVGE